MLKIKYKGRQPEKMSAEAAGYDLISDCCTIIAPGDSVCVGTGTYLDIPTGWFGLIKSRSGLSVKHRIEVGAGVADSDYRGEIKVHLHNFGFREFRINTGDRIAQIIFLPVNHILWEEGELSDTERGAKGFGSTGE